MANYQFSPESRLFNELKGQREIKRQLLLRREGGAHRNNYERELKSLVNGVRVSELTSPKIHGILGNCKRSLGYRKNISVFVGRNLDSMAQCFLLRGDPFIEIDGGALALFDEEELHFVIGHEIGHLKLNHPLLEVADDTALTARQRVRWAELRRLREVSADRCGMVCCGSFDAAKRALFKIATGTQSQLLHPNDAAIEVQIEKIAELVEERDYLRDIKSSHPYSLLRILALKYFADSSSNAVRQEIDPQQEADRKIQELLSIMRPKPLELDHAILLHASFYVAFADGALDGAEEAAIGEFCDETSIRVLKVKLKIKRDRKAFLRQEIELLVAKHAALSTPKKAIVLENLIAVAKADKQFSELEKDAIREVGSILGLENLFVEASLSDA